jgi:hypothetical protein
LTLLAIGPNDIHATTGELIRQLILNQRQAIAF